MFGNLVSNCDTELTTGQYLSFAPSDSALITFTISDEVYLSAKRLDANLSYLVVLVFPNTLAKAFTISLMSLLPYSAGGLSISLRASQKGCSRFLVACSV